MLKSIIDFISNYKNPLLLITYILISIIVLFLIFNSKIETYIQLNRDKLIKNPILAPLVNIYAPITKPIIQSNVVDKGSLNPEELPKTDQNTKSWTQSTSGGIIASFKKVILGFIKTILKPFYFILGIFAKIVTKFRKMIDNMRRYILGIRAMFNTVVTDTLKRLRDGHAAIIYYKERMRSIIKKQVATISLMRMYMQAMGHTFKSLMNGPITGFTKFATNPGYLGMLFTFAVSCGLCLFSGNPFVMMVACPICFICFDKNTEVEMEDGSIKMIKDIVIGDIIKGNSGVVGSVVTNGTGVPMYDYNGVQVSGDHLVYENNKWVRVVDSEDGNLTINESERIVCLMTDNHKIQISGITFSDYFETDDYKTNKWIMEKVQNHMNNNKYNSICNDIYPWGFGENTLIELENDETKYIRDIQIGDILHNGNRILGVIKMDRVEQGIKLYNYKGIEVSGTQLTNYLNILWTRIAPVCRKSIEKTHSKYVYSLITSDRTIAINGITFADFLECTDEDLNNEMDDRVEEVLNN
jgi:hypothetical protein